MGGGGGGGGPYSLIWRSRCRRISARKIRRGVRHQWAVMCAAVHCCRQPAWCNVATALALHCTFCRAAARALRVAFARCRYRGFRVRVALVRLCRVERCEARQTAALAWCAHGDMPSRESARGWPCPSCAMPSRRASATAKPHEHKREHSIAATNTHACNTQLATQRPRCRGGLSRAV